MPTSLFHPLRLLSPVFLLLLGSFQAHAQTIVCFGDSLTAGFGAQPGLSYPAFLQKDLTKAGYTGSVRNDGTTGAGTDAAIALLPTVLKVHPDIVILEFGAVDGLRKQPPPLIAHNLNFLIQSLRGQNIRVLLAAVEMPSLLTGASYAERFNRIYSALAHKYKLQWVPSLLKGVYGVPGLTSMDHMHPNGLGYLHVAENVLPVLEPMLRK